MRWLENTTQNIVKKSGFVCVCVWSEINNTVPIYKNQNHSYIQI